MRTTICFRQSHLLPLHSPLSIPLYSTAQAGAVTTHDGCIYAAKCDKDVRGFGPTTTHALARFDMRHPHTSGHHHAPRSHVHRGCSSCSTLLLLLLLLLPPGLSGAPAGRAPWPAAGRRLPGCACPSGPGPGGVGLEWARREEDGSGVVSWKDERVHVEPQEFVRGLASCTWSPAQLVPSTSLPSAPPIHLAAYPPDHPATPSPRPHSATLPYPTPSHLLLHALQLARGPARVAQPGLGRGDRLVCSHGTVWSCLIARTPRHPSQCDTIRALCRRSDPRALCWRPLPPGW